MKFYGAIDTSHVNESGTPAAITHHDACGLGTLEILLNI